MGNKIVVELAPEMRQRIRDMAKRDGAITDSEVIRKLLRLGLEVESQVRA